MCYRCTKLKKQGITEGFPNHVPHNPYPLTQPAPKKPLDVRIKEMKERAAHKKEYMLAKIPIYWTNPDVRAARVRTIRQKLGLTLREFAPVLGISLCMMEKIEAGTRVCSMPVLKVAERELRAQFHRDLYAKRKEKKRVEANAGPKPAPLAMPTDPTLRMQVFMMYVRDVPLDEIARKLALRPEVVQQWVSQIA